jgi:hypothetical protein
MQKLTGDPKKVVAAVDRALTAKHPKRRYRCDNVSRVQLALTSVTPTAFTDALFAAATTSNEPPHVAPGNQQTRQATAASDPRPNCCGTARRRVPRDPARGPGGFRAVPQR